MAKPHKSVEMLLTKQCAGTWDGEVLAQIRGYDGFQFVQARHLEPAATYQNASLAATGGHRRAREKPSHLVECERLQSNEGLELHVHSVQSQHIYATSESRRCR